MKNDGGFAFPSATEYNEEGVITDLGTYGMTLRDYFAGRVLSGVLGNSEFERDRKALDEVMPDVVQIAALASLCYQYADAMIAERSKD